MRFIDPTKIPEKDLPLIVLSDQTSGLIQWAIKWRTNSAWNHIMIMHRTDGFASQGNVYSVASLKRYMGKNGRLKFFSIKANNVQKMNIIYSVLNKLKLPWWKRQYDWIAIIGQALGLKWLSGPTHICSEDVAYHLNTIITPVPNHPSPQDLNEWMENSPHFEVYGYWQGD